MIIGGNKLGGFVNSADQVCLRIFVCLTNGAYLLGASFKNNPTYEFFPPRGNPVGLNILTTTLPANLYPLTWLLPTGNLFIQTNWKTEIFDYKANTEYPLPDIPHAYVVKFYAIKPTCANLIFSVRTYPASGGSVMLPLTPQNNWTATIM
jgi:hypothetical protein